MRRPISERLLNLGANGAGYSARAVTLASCPQGAGAKRGKLGKTGTGGRLPIGRERSDRAPARPRLARRPARRAMDGYQ